jgi:hypothetical protein
LANEAVPMSTALKIQLHEKLPLFSIQVCWIFEPVYIIDVSEEEIKNSTVLIW